MSKILVNNNIFDVEIADTGVTVSASSSYTIPPQDYPTFSASSDVITLLANLTLVLNDGGLDVTNLSNAVNIIKGFCPIPPDPDPGEPFFFDFSEEISGSSPFTVISYVVPALQELFLIHLDISCRTESAIQILLNGSPIGDMRTGAAKPSSSFHWYPNRKCVAGDLVEVILTKRASTPDIDVGAHLMGLTFQTD